MTNAINTNALEFIAGAKITPETNRINDPAVIAEPEYLIKPGNSKMSEYVGVINMPAGFTCPGDAPCNNPRNCYALKGNYRTFASTATLRAWQCFRLFMLDADAFFERINAELDEADRLRPWKYFRWHETGDIVNARYFEGMVDVARRHKNTIFMAFTKKYEIVNAWIDENGSLPKNLVIIFSIWGKYGLGVNRHNLPCAYVEGVGGDEYISKSARECNGGCKDCDFQCWKLRKRQSVVFHKH